MVEFYPTIRWVLITILFRRNFKRIFGPPMLWSRNIKIGLVLVCVIDDRKTYRQSSRLLLFNNLETRLNVCSANDMWYVTRRKKVPSSFRFLPLKRGFSHYPMNLSEIYSRKNPIAVSIADCYWPLEIRYRCILYTLGVISESKIISRTDNHVAGLN